MAFSYVICYQRRWHSWMESIPFAHQRFPLCQMKQLETNACSRFFKIPNSQPGVFESFLKESWLLVGGRGDPVHTRCCIDMPMTHCFCSDENTVTANLLDVAGRDLESGKFLLILRRCFRLLSTGQLLPPRGRPATKKRVLFESSGAAPLRPFKLLTRQT